MGRKKERDISRIRIVFINTFAKPSAQSLPTISTVVPTLVASSEEEKLVTVEVDGRKIRGKIVNMSDSHIYLVDENGKLHVIPLAKLIREEPRRVMILAEA